MFDVCDPLRFGRASQIGGSALVKVSNRGYSKRVRRTG